MRANFSKKRAIGILEEIAAKTPEALDAAANALPDAFPQAIVDSVEKAILERLDGLKLRDTE